MVNYCHSVWAVHSYLEYCADMYIVTLGEYSQCQLHYLPSLASRSRAISCKLRPLHTLQIPNPLKFPAEQGSVKWSHFTWPLRSKSFGSFCAFGRMGLLHLAKQDSLDSRTSTSSTTATSTSYSKPQWSTSRGPQKCLAILHGLGDLNVTALALSRGFLYAGSDRGEIRAWGYPEMREVTKFGGGEGAVKCLVVVGNKVISAHQDGIIRVWRPSKSHPHEHRLVKTLPSKDLTNLLPVQSFSLVTSPLLAVHVPEGA